MQSKPTLRRTRLGRRLRKMRERANLTLEEAAPLLEKTRSALQRIEKGETRADVHLLRSMMEYYHQDEPDLLDMAREAYKPGWWRTYGIQDMGYVDLETEAKQVRELALLHIPGLLQTEAYMRAVFQADHVRRSQEELRNQVAVRLIRQQRLTTTENPLKLIAVIDESALRKPVGSREVMREQLRHLIDVSSLPTVELRVLADDTGAHAGMTAAYAVLAFPHREDPEMLYIEYPTGALHIEDETEVWKAKMVFAQLRSAALNPADSVELIERVTIERHGPE